jgi:hypothetical protein
MEMKLKFHENVKFDKELIPLVMFQFERAGQKLDRSKITVKAITLKVVD